MTPRYGKKWSKEAKNLWRSIHADYDIDAHQVEILRAACEALSRMHQARDILILEGLTFTTSTGAIRKHPACSIEKDSHTQFIQSIKALGIEKAVAGAAARGPGRPYTGPH